MCGGFLAVLDMHAVTLTLLLCEVTCLFWSGAWCLVSVHELVSSYQIPVWPVFATPDSVTLDCQVWLNACCMLLAYPWFYKPQCAMFTCHYVVLEQCFYLCFSSAPTPHYNATVSKGLHLWSEGEHCHPLWGQGEASSQVRQSLLLCHIDVCLSEHVQDAISKLISI